jgi:hypothetical protein
MDTREERETIKELRRQLTRRYGADAAQEAFTLALEKGSPLIWDSLASLANRHRQREATWLIRHIPLEHPDSLSWDPIENRYILGVDFSQDSQ